MGLDTAPIDSPRLRLEPLRVAHAAEMVQVLADPALYRFTGGVAPTLPELEERYRRQVAGPEGSSEVWRNWILRPVEGGEVIGYVQATIEDERADVAWLIGSASQGRGYAKEAARAMCDWLISTGVRELQAHIHPDHVASQRVARSIGLGDSGEVDDDGEQIWTLPGRSAPSGG